MYDKSPMAYPSNSPVVAESKAENFANETVEHILNEFGEQSAGEIVMLIRGRFCRRMDSQIQELKDRIAENSEAIAMRESMVKSTVAPL